MGPVEANTKTDYAGEDQKQFSRPTGKSTAFALDYSVQK
jgi:hypothetical protein